MSPPPDSDADAGVVQFGVAVLLEVQAPGLLPVALTQRSLVQQGAAEISMP